jgi:preprotein translocase subunit SecF
VSLTIVAAILTLLGYSGNDTIIIFDRVRENLKKDRKSPLYDVLNRSINETLPQVRTDARDDACRDACACSFRWEVLRPFAIVMTFGIFVATFSSIYVAVTAAAVDRAQVAAHRRQQGWEGSRARVADGDCLPRSGLLAPESRNARGTR